MTIGRLWEHLFVGNESEIVLKTRGREWGDLTETERDELKLELTHMYRMEGIKCR